jgi:hypothetical protein
MACPVIVVSANQHCYELVDKAMDWYEAEAYAKTLSHNGVYGHLATIISGQARLG